MGNVKSKKIHKQYQGTLREFQEIFDACDVDRDGLISKEEVVAAFQRFGFSPSPPEINIHFGAVDKSNRGVLTFEEFFDVMHRHPAISSLEKAFSVFDLDGNGQITVQELHKCMIELGQRVDLQQLNDMFDTVDLNRDCKINFEEFARMMSAHRVLSIDAVFHQFDIDRDGFISKSELMNAFKSLGVKASSSDINNIFTMADHDRDGKISFIEFASFLET